MIEVKMKIKVMKRYTGKEGDVRPGDLLEVSEQRGAVLVAQKKAKKVSESMPEVKEKVKPDNKATGPKETKKASK